MEEVFRVGSTFEHISFDRPLSGNYTMCEFARELSACGLSKMAQLPVRHLIESISNLTSGYFKYV
jgi:hypothetical protein